MDQQTDRESRRKFLKTAGKFAVYTPPALIVMSSASTQSFANSGGGYTDTTNGSTKDCSGQTGVAKAICELLP